MKFKYAFSALFRQCLAGCAKQENTKADAIKVVNLLIGSLVL